MSEPAADVVVATICTVTTQPYAMIGRHGCTVRIEELWLPPPYNVSVSISGDVLNCLSSERIRGRKSESRGVVVSKAFAEQCRAYVDAKAAIQDQMYTITGQPRPAPSVHDLHFAFAEAVFRRWLKTHRGEIRVGQHYGVFLGDDAVSVYGDDYVEAQRDMQSRAGGRVIMVQEYQHGLNRDSEEEED